MIVLKLLYCQIPFNSILRSEFSIDFNTCFVSFPRKSRWESQMDKLQFNKFVAKEIYELGILMQFATFFRIAITSLQQTVRKIVVRNILLAFLFTDIVLTYPWLAECWLTLRNP